ncbi:hypothetical protein HCN44_007332 [Aphidius gifuensis]|uniref:Uncharacterized protein n=1 Tax=Aphidius gifuensis TaxID=684658 RepID=A0A834XLE5_APHGI|nr:hypothetical protein HCN44_007332 [Aphidius gifuensis]
MLKCHEASQEVQNCNQMDLKNLEKGHGTCPVCGNEAKLRCAGCKIIYYCSQDHQRKDWTKHKSSCNNIWKVESNDELGRHLIATRDIDIDDLILSELPLTWGPSIHSDLRICVGCGNKNIAARCPGCSWYACKLSCDGLVDDNRHAIECKLFSKTRIIPRCDILLPLRMIIMKIRNPKKWKILSSLQSHENLRENGTDAYEEDEIISQNLKPILNIFGIDRNVLTKICGLIDVNGLETNPPEGSIGIYQNACLLEHQCVSNTRHFFTLDDKGRPKIIIKAARKIKKGEHLSTTYTHVLWTTKSRREHLLATKYFKCKCKRCEDPTELDTHIGTLKCPCGPGIILPKNPLDDETEWSCNLCPGILEILLHPGHQHCIAVGHSLIQLLPSSDSKKSQICKQILRTTSILDPHGSRLALYIAVALHELSKCPDENSEQHIKRGIDLLKYEPVDSPGYKFKKILENELN